MGSEEFGPKAQIYFLFCFLKPPLIGTISGWRSSTDNDRDTWDQLPDPRGEWGGGDRGVIARPCNLGNLPRHLVFLLVQYGFRTEN